jgi:hypothetical protein
MKRKPSGLLLWLLSLAITLGSAYYQRKTGPTYPLRGKIVIGDQKISYRLLRSESINKDAKVKVVVPDTSLSGYVEYKKLNAADGTTRLQMMRHGDTLITFLPRQPMAGKLVYQVMLTGGGKEYTVNKKPAVIRFKGDVPAFIMLLHILVLFAAMMHSARAGLEAILRGKRTYRLAVATAILLILGGLVLGPMVQKYAFDSYWTGWPFGRDLTDNKTLLAVILWIVAAWRLHKNRENRAWPIVAAVFLLLIYLIPHSLFGSELDYSSGQVNTGR